MGRVDHDYRGISGPPLTIRVAELAERQWGVVALAQLRDLGVSRGAVEHWQRSGRLRPLHRGVYAVGHAALRAEGRWLAATLACGGRAVLSHASAAALWGIRATQATQIDVTAPRSRSARAGIRVHRTRGLAEDDVTTKDGIATTTVERTLLDLAAMLPADALEATIARAEAQRLTDASGLTAVLARGHGHHGTPALARAISSDPRLTRSVLERRFVRLVRDAGLPLPETNAWLTLGAGEEWQVDALWRDHAVIVELDGWTTHRTRRAFENDRARGARLTTAGFRLLRITYRQLTGDAPAIARMLRTVLAAPSTSTDVGRIGHVNPGQPGPRPGGEPTRRT